MSEIKILFPGREVKVNANGQEEVVVIKPFTFGQIPKVSGLLGDLMPAVQHADGDILLMIETAGEPLIKLASLAANKPREWFDTLDSDSGFELILAIVEENKEFFEKKMKPVVERLVAKVKVNQDGEQSTQN